MKIISISVFGSDPRYIIGAKRQIDLAKKYCPSFTVRIYTDNVKNFTEYKDEIQLIEKNTKVFGSFWRFEPLFESKENIVLVRDSDSRFTIREARAIQEWLDSNLEFHNFKDHDATYEFPIMAGMFGFKGKFDYQLLEIMNNVGENHHYYLSDQLFLQQFIYPLVANKTLYHDKNVNGWFKDTRKKLVNKYDFCGQGYYEDDMPIYKDILDKVDMTVPKLKENKFSEGIMIE